MAAPGVTVAPVARDVDVVCCTGCCPTFRRTARLHIKREGDGVVVEISPPKDVSTTATLSHVRVHLPQRKDATAS